MTNQFFKVIGITSRYHRALFTTSTCYWQHAHGVGARQAAIYEYLRTFEWRTCLALDDRQAFLPGEIDWPVMGLSAGVCLVVTLIVGLISAFQTRHLDLAGALKAESSGVVGGKGRTWMRSGLVIFQVCLIFILLVGAALLLESLQKIRTTDPGFFNDQSCSHGRAPWPQRDTPRPAPRFLRTN